MTHANYEKLFMNRAATLLRTVGREAIPVATFTVTDGDVAVEVMKTPHEEETQGLVDEYMRRGIGLERVDRLVLPSEGELFMEALGEQLARATYWSLKPGSTT